MIATADNPNLAILELAVRALGELTDSLVFIGGCATGLLVTETRANQTRAPKTWTSSLRSQPLVNITASKPCWPHAASSMIPRPTRQSAVG